MPGPALALVTSDNTSGGTMLTWAAPLALFVIVAVVLYLRFSRPHRRVPGPPGGADRPGRATARARCDGRRGGRRAAHRGGRRGRGIGRRARRGGTGVSGRNGSE